MDTAFKKGKMLAMPDMLVRLYNMPEIDNSRAQKEGVAVKRAMALDKTKILTFVRENFEDEGWVSECERAIFNDPISCYIAVKDEEVIGFACYDATAKGVFGPMGIKETARGKGIGEALLRACLHSMKEKGYAYAAIGWVTDAVEFYKKAVGAEVIEGSLPEKSVYKNLISP